MWTQDSKQTSLSSIFYVADCISILMTIDFRILYINLFNVFSNGKKGKMKRLIGVYDSNYTTSVYQHTCNVYRC